MPRMSRRMEKITKPKARQILDGGHMSLQDEIAARTSKIFRESYQMSIGELINLYRDGEMDIHPEFQRVFRWNEYQKTKLIESIMLNIPIPSIFVSQNEEGIWDVIDGVQRLSTIFQFVGIFKDEEGKSLPPLILQKTDYLPSFEGVRWEARDGEQGFTKEQQLFFKRARFDVVIMKKESDPNTKYELFQRLNTGGSLLSPQEVRNCLMIMTNKAFYEFIADLEKDNSFQNCLPLTGRRIDEQYRTELVLRLIVAAYIDWSRLREYEDFSQMLDKETIFLSSSTLDYQNVKDQFVATFKLLDTITGEDSFKKYNGEKHLGPVMAASFQAVAFGVFANIVDISNLPDNKTWLKNRILQLYSESEFNKNIIPGVRSIPRYKDLSLFGAEFFKP